jgi:hypothetical protein
LLDELALESDLLRRKSLDLTYELEVLINCKGIPYDVRLSGETKEFALINAVEVFDLATENADASR